LWVQRKGKKKTLLGCPGPAGCEKKKRSLPFGAKGENRNKLQPVTSIREKKKKKDGKKTKGGLDLR